VSYTKQYLSPANNVLYETQSEWTREWLAGPLRICFITQGAFIQHL